MKAELDAEGDLHVRAETPAECAALRFATLQQGLFVLWMIRVGPEASLTFRWHHAATAAEELAKIAQHLPKPGAPAPVTVPGEAVAR